MSQCAHWDVTNLLIEMSLAWKWVGGRLSPSARRRLRTRWVVATGLRWVLAGGSAAGDGDPPRPLVFEDQGGLGRGHGGVAVQLVDHELAESLDLSGPQFSGQGIPVISRCCVLIMPFPLHLVRGSVPERGVEPDLIIP